MWNEQCASGPVKPTPPRSDKTGIRYKETRGNISMKRPRLKWGLCALLLATVAAAPAFADDAPPKLDSGDTAWMLASTALVLMMTIPGLALFYAGMVRKKNILATMMQSFTICCIVTIVWMVAGYSIAFTTGNAFMGDFSRILLHGIADHIVKGNDSQAFVLASG